MIKLVIFDIDGVLLDSFESNLNYFRQVFKAAGYKRLPSAGWYKKHFHFTMPETILKFAGTTTSEEYNRLIDLGKKFYNSRKDFKLTPYSLFIVKELSKKYKLAIATGRMRDGVKVYFDASGLKECFSEVAYLGRYKKPKPDPESINLILKKLKIKPDNAVFIGDSSHADFGAAKLAGTKFIYFNKKKLATVDGYTNSFRSLPQIISQLK